MRLFFAVLLPTQIREAIARSQELLRARVGQDGIRWTAEDQFHYTLKFLGEVPEERLPLIIETAGKVAAQISPFLLGPAGIGAFPAERRPQLLWLGAREGVPLMIRLAESLDSTLSEIGFAPEARGFHPHLTLARVKSSTGQKAAARALADPSAIMRKVDKYGVFPLGEFVLISSVLHSAGSIYTVIKEFPLAV